MPFLKHRNFQRETGAGGFERIEAKISVSVDGYFTTRIDEKYRDCAKGVLEFDAIESNSPNDNFRVSFNSLEDLEKGIELILAEYCNPDIKHENIIRYKFDTCVNFTENSKGDMEQDATKDGFIWGFKNRDRYESSDHFEQFHHKPYHIKIYARAVIKTTKTFGEHKRVDYHDYQGESIGNEISASEKLNSWSYMGISDKEEINEIPYSDESALFFNEIIWGIVKLSKLIQDHTFNKDDLLKTITSKQKLLSTN